MEIAVGDTVTWKTAGKVARLEGMTGLIVTGVVLSIKGELITVMPKHRMLDGAMFPAMQATLQRDQVLSVQR